MRSPRASTSTGLFAAVACVREGAPLAEAALAEAREEASKLAESLRECDARAASLASALEHEVARSDEARARAWEIERHITTLGPPPALAEDALALFPAPFPVESARSTNVWTPEASAAMSADETRSDRARRLLTLARDILEREKRLVEKRARESAASGGWRDAWKVHWTEEGP